MAAPKPNSIEEYIAGFPAEVQQVLQEVRNTIKHAAPEATETISYAIPTFVLNGNLVHFAAFKNHIGFYAVPSGHHAFEAELSVYKGGKGSVQFPLNKPMPLDLISRIVKFRVQENQQKASKKKTIRTCQNGHQFTKTSDCPTCPECEKEQKPKEGVLALLSAPARRALENNGIKTEKDLAKFSEKEVLGFHGMGKSSIPKLKEALAAQHLTFKNG